MEAAKNFAKTAVKSASSAADKVATLVLQRRDQTSFKMLLIGETGSGKTSFLNLLCNCGLIQALGFEEGLEQFRQFNDVKLENASSRKMESKTSGAKLYKVELGELKVGVIDTPGFGDSRGIEEDKKHSKKIVDALKCEEYINCVCLVVNGRQARMSATLRYVLTEITSVLPRDVLKNVIVVFTNTADPLELNFDTELFREYFGEEIEHQFTIENPYCRFEKAKLKKGKLPIDKIAKTLKKSFEETADTLREMCEAIKEIKPVHTHHFVTLYETKQKIERKVLTMLTEYDNQQRLEKQIKQAQAKASAALEAKNLNKDYEATHTIIRWIVIEEPHKRHNTLCGAAGCYSNCHTPCYLEKSFDKEEFKNCRCMKGWVACSECGHHYTLHYHNVARFEKVEETENFVNEDMKKRFEAATSNEEINNILQNALEQKRRQSEIERKRLSEQLLVTMEEFHRLGASRNYAKLLENHLAVIEQRLEGTVGKETLDLRKTKEEIEKKLQLVLETMNEPWSTRYKTDQKEWACCVLGLDPNCSIDKNQVLLMKAFKRISVRDHPDKGGDEEYFKRIEHAKQTLLSYCEN